MNRRANLLALALAVLPACWGLKTPATPASPTPATSAGPADPRTPPGLDGVRLGMTRAELLAARPRAAIDTKTSELIDFRTELVEANPAPGIVRVTYYLAKSAGEPLYEVIVDYADAARAQGLYASSYAARGTPVEGEQIPTVELSGHAFPIRAWAFEGKLIVVAVLPGTEWDEDADEATPSAADPSP